MVFVNPLSNEIHILCFIDMYFDPFEEPQMNKNKYWYTLSLDTLHHFSSCYEMLIVIYLNFKFYGKKLNTVAICHVSFCTITDLT